MTGPLNATKQVFTTLTFPERKRRGSKRITPNHGRLWIEAGHRRDAKSASMQDADMEGEKKRLV